METSDVSQHGFVVLERRATVEDVSDVGEVRLMLATAAAADAASRRLCAGGRAAVVLLLLGR